MSQPAELSNDSQSKSPLQSYRLMPPGKQRQLLQDAATRENVPLEQLQAHLAYQWEGWQARPSQLAPPGDWLIWIILSGRGWGKTRTGAEYAKKWALEHPGSRIALVAETFADGRDTMIEGESGLLSILPLWTLRGRSVESAWNRSLGELYLENGSRFDIYSSEKPDQLRGPQHHYAWADEVAKWNDAHEPPHKEGTSWSNLMLGLRLGAHPRCIVTTTPKPVKLLVGTAERAGILKGPNTIVTRGSTYENLDNLAPPFRAQIISLYEGTRIGRQELLAEVLTDAVGALWSDDLIHYKRGAEYGEPSVPLEHDWQRIIVGVDPSGAADEDSGSSEIGIIVGGLGRTDQRGYVLADYTIRTGPEKWAREVVRAFGDFKADLVVAERNYGGDMVRATLRAVDPSLPVKLVTATRGKRVRAEPIAALYEQGKIFHARPFPRLEEQMTGWVPDSGMPSPDRLDAMVWAFTELMGRAAQVTAVSTRDYTDPVYRKGGLVLIGEQYVDKDPED